MSLGLGMGLGMGQNVAASGGGGGGSTLGWNAASIDGANYTLSGTNNTVATHVGSGTNHTIMGTASKTSGSFTVTPTSIAGNAIVGMASAAHATPNDFLGDEGADVGYISTGTVVFNGSNVQTWATYTNGDLIEVDYAGSTVTFKKNGVTQGSVTVTGGTAYFPAASTNQSGVVYTLAPISW